MSYFVMQDAPSRPQRVAISWQLLTLDDESADRPDEMQDGFWPSLDPDDAGYIGEPQGDDIHDGGQARLDRLQEEAAARLEAFDSGDWNYIGIVARAVIHIPCGGSSFRVMTLDSAGLWGVESDCGDSYKLEVFTDQKSDLLTELRTLGRALGTEPDFDEEGPEL